MATTVVHVRKNPKFDVYIGRTCMEFDESPWHNPFLLGPHRDGTRTEVIAKYREYVLASPELMARLPELKGKVLGCWCRPRLECHGDVLVELVDAL